MVHFVGAGPGAPDLITMQGVRLLRQADTVIYAGSLVNPALLSYCKDGCTVFNSAELTLEQVIKIYLQEEEQHHMTVRLHTGDPSVYGAIQEQMDALRANSIPFRVTPGVSSFCAAAAALETEYTLPGVSQTVILTRLTGKTPVPERESLFALAAHGASMVIFLSAGMMESLQDALLKGAYTADTPAAIVYKASWPEEKLLRCSVGKLSELAHLHGIRSTALVLAGDFLSSPYERSCLYNPSFTTQYRKGVSTE